MAQKVKNHMVKSTCGLCQAGCGMLLHVMGDAVHHVEGDPESPVNRGVLCAKGLASLEYLHHPDRLKYPLKRKGEKGGGDWDQISWDEAMDIVAEELLKARTAHGPESLVCMRGSFKGGV